MDRDLVRRELLRRRQHLQERLDRVRSDRRRASGPLSADFAEQAVERENDEALDFFDDRTRAEIEGIGQALQRIEDETYGICQTCGDSISEGRLDIVPAAATCAPCAAGRDAEPK